MMLQYNESFNMTSSTTGQVHCPVSWIRTVSSRFGCNVHVCTLLQVYIHGEHYCKCTYMYTCSSVHLSIINPRYGMRSETDIGLNNTWGKSVEVWGCVSYMYVRKPCYNYQLSCRTCRQALTIFGQSFNII